MPNRTEVALLLVVLATLLSTRSISAQAEPDSIRYRNDCRLAEQILTTGHPHTHLRWAGSVIRTCGAGAFSRATSAGIRRLASSSDTAALSALWDNAFFSVTSQDAFDLALEVAADPQATSAARVFAMLGAMRMLYPDRVIRLETLIRSDRVGAYRSSWCFDGRTAHRYQRVIGAPVVTSDGRHELRAVGRQILQDGSSPPTVRAAAYCASRV